MTKSGKRKLPQIGNSQGITPKWPFILCLTSGSYTNQGRVPPLAHLLHHITVICRGRAARD